MRKRERNHFHKRAVWAQTFKNKPGFGENNAVPNILSSIGGLHDVCRFTRLKRVTHVILTRTPAHTHTHTLYKSHFRLFGYEAFQVTPNRCKLPSYRLRLGCSCPLCNAQLRPNPPFWRAFHPVCVQRCWWEWSSRWPASPARSWAPPCPPHP